MFFGIVAIAGTTLFFVLRPAPVRHLAIELGVRYHLQAKEPGLLRRLDQYGMPMGGADSMITLQGRNLSYAVFENNWAVFRINFVRGTERETFHFIVMTISHTGRAGFTAMVRKIYDAELRTYTISASGDRLIMRTDTTRRILIPTEEPTPSPEYRVIRQNAVVMKFALDRRAT